MFKISLYLLTAVVHGLIAMLFVQLFGFIGMIIIPLHWTLFGGVCCLTYMERWIHLKLLGTTYLQLKPFKTTIFGKLINRL